ncbi:MAG: hypothetical protein HWD82_02140 [Flavobacteriaceae bacterium]|nr:hypothetical protein [Flavobacteriaceae bacterium]
MNKNILNFIATIILSVVLSLIFPWWSIMVAAFIASILFPLKNSKIFFVPFLAILLYWGFYSYALSSINNFTLAKKISQLLMLGGDPYLLMLVTGLVGGIAAGISGVFGKQIINTLKKNK